MILLVVTHLFQLLDRCSTTAEVHVQSVQDLPAEPGTQSETILPVVP